MNGLWGAFGKKKAVTAEIPERLITKGEGGPLASDAVLASVAYGVLKVMEFSNENFKTNLKLDATTFATKNGATGKVLQLIGSDNDLKFALGLAALFLISKPENYDGDGKNIQQALQHAFDVKNALEK